MRKSYRTILTVVVVALVIAVVFYPDLGARELIPWRTDFDAARAEADRLHKPMLVDFGAGWCGYCTQMNHTTWADKSVAAAVAGMIPVKVDVDQHHDLARQYSVDGLPAYAIIGSDGNVLRFGDGYRTPPEFLDWLSNAPLP